MFTKIICLFATIKKTKLQTTAPASHYNQEHSVSQVKADRTESTSNDTNRFWCFGYLYIR